MLTLLLVLQLGVASSTTSLEPQGLAWRNTKAAEIASDLTLAASLGVDTWDSFHCADRRHCFIAQAERTGVDMAIAELMKWLIHRERPDKSDFKSMPSEHTMLTAQGRRLAFVLPLTGATGYFRMAANRHYFTDVLVGAGVGLATGRWIK